MVRFKARGATAPVSAALQHLQSSGSPFSRSQRQWRARSLFERV